MKKFLLAAAALALGVHGALASDGWFKVTEPILICEVSQDMACDHVKVGTVFYFDRADQGDIAGLTHLWRMPDITEVFVMPGDWRSAFKPTHAPKGWWLAVTCNQPFLVDMRCKWNWASLRICDRDALKLLASFAFTLTLTARLSCRASVPPLLLITAAEIELAMVFGSDPPNGGAHD
jgi:hypothetical protein